MSDTQRGDVVELLKEQHRRIRTMFDEVESTSDPARQERFEELRRFLAVHETAEELVVHPQARQGQRGDAVVDARVAEERSAKELLAELDGMNTRQPAFDSKFNQLRTAVLAHAESEERDEFPLLRANVDDKTRATMADAVRAAEAVAPTRPHPGVESPVAIAMTGPLASLVDRARDAVRSVMGGS